MRGRAGSHGKEMALVELVGDNIHNWLPLVAVTGGVLNLDA